MTAVLRESLGYRADWDVAKMRYYQITVTRIQPGYGRDFEQVRALVNAAHEKAKIEERWAVYQVMSGAPAHLHHPAAHASLAELDKGEASHGKSTRTRSERTAASACASSTVTQSEHGQRAHGLQPKMSYLPKEFMDRDPEF
jgi:hypothetical protein